MHKGFSDKRREEDANFSGREEESDDAEEDGDDDDDEGKRSGRRRKLKEHKKTMGKKQKDVVEEEGERCHDVVVVVWLPCIIPNHLARADKMVLGNGCGLKHIRCCNFCTTWPWPARSLRVLQSSI
jgi:hypothetical protein